MKPLSKVLLLLTMCMSVALSASFENKLVALIKQRTSQDVKVLSVQNLKSSESLKLVIVQTGDLKVPLFVTSDASLVFGATNVFFSQDLTDSADVANFIKQTQNNNQKADGKEIAKLFQSLQDHEMVKLTASTQSSKVTYIVADPNCPSCQKEIQNLQKRLKDSNVYVVLVGFLGKDSALKSSMLRVRLAELPDTQTKIALLQEVFKKGYELPQKYQNDDFSDIMNLSERVSAAGIRSVPYVYEKQQ
ncbi:protein-disulfide isomerase [uncultured Helicobacter sp.]|uniref:protein-disulfide isomerase n=1 Tax=uncultured Helicobacter sp. TaxID=175537 RepID=UPI00374ECD19